MGKDIQGGVFEIIFIDESTEMPDFKRMDPKQYKAMIHGEWGNDMGDIEPQIIEPITKLREGKDFLTMPVKRMTKKEMESIYRVKPEE